MGCVVGQRAGLFFRAGELRQQLEQAGEDPAALAQVRAGEAE